MQRTLNVKNSFKMRYRNVLWCAKIRKYKITFVSIKFNFQLRNCAGNFDCVDVIFASSDVWDINLIDIYHRMQFMKKQSTDSGCIIKVFMDNMLRVVFRRYRCFINHYQIAEIKDVSDDYCHVSFIE